MKYFFLPAFTAIVCLVLLLGSFASQANNDGYDSDSCSCHGSTKSSTTTITVIGLPNALYTPGETYQVTVSVSDASLASNEGGIWIWFDQGSLATTDPNLELVDSGDPKELMQSSDSAVSWTFNWTAPTDLVWVNIQIVAMVADGDDGISGDLWNSKDLQINAEGSTNTSAPPLPEKPDDDDIKFTDLVLVLSLTAVIATIAVHMVIRVFIKPIKHEKRIIYLDEDDSEGESH
ncbi:MAG: choice-of-anchor V domain-containing protein [Candidatus Heimdallarchaeota archaeon]